MLRAISAEYEMVCQEGALVADMQAVLAAVGVGRRCRAFRRSTSDRCTMSVFTLVNERWLIHGVPSRVPPRQCMRQPPVIR